MLTEKPNAKSPAAKTEKVRGMNASLTNSQGSALTERDPGRLHITRRQIAFALVLAVLGAIAAVYTVESVTSGDASFPAVVTTSKVFDMNFPTAAQVTAISVKVGQRVSPGQVLARQDTSTLQTQLDADEALVKADKDALAQTTAPQLTPAQREQFTLQVQQAQTALSNAQAVLAGTTVSARAAVTGAEAAVSSSQDLATTDTNRYTQACPGGPIAPAPILNSTQFATAEAQFTHCQDLQLQMDKDLAALSQAQAQVPVVEAQSQQSINSAQAAVNAAQAALNTAQFQLTLQSSPTNVAAEAQAEAALSQAEGELAQTQQSLQQATLVAPSAGVVAEVYGAVGEYIGPDGVHLFSAPPALPANQPSGFSLFPSQPASSGSDSTSGGDEPLIEVVGGQQQVMAQVPESHVSSLPVGKTTSISVAALHLRAAGVVTEVILNPTRDSAGVTYDVVITLNRTVPGLLPGMSATVRT
jgi:HlyD family secretion protein